MLSLLAATIGGVLAIVASVVASRLDFDQQRQLERERLEQAATTAARVLWIEFGTRIDEMEEQLDPWPPGDCTVDDFACEIRAGEERTLRKPLLPIEWSDEDRRVLATTLSAGEWFGVASAHSAWTRFVQRYAMRPGVLREEALALAFDAFQTLAGAQELLVPYDPVLKQQLEQGASPSPTSA